jgi:hypothetical protein
MTAASALAAGELRGRGALVTDPFLWKLYVRNISMETVSRQGRPSRTPRVRDAQARHRRPERQCGAPFIASTILCASMLAVVTRTTGSMTVSLKPHSDAFYGNKAWMQASMAGAVVRVENGPIAQAMATCRRPPCSRH